MPRLLIAGVCLFSLYAAEPNKLSFTCKEDDMQWAGLGCSSQEPCPIYLELSGIATSGQRLFLAGDIHSAQATLYSVLLSSSDAGSTWTEPIERVRGEDLDRIQFHSFDTGWISGAETAPLPNDPFLLITHDGGKTWRKQSVMAEGTVGSIQQFHFESATTGKLIIDRHASDSSDPRFKLLETTNGGENWSVRETSATAMTNALGQQDDETDYRLQTDPAGKFLNVQKQWGEKWNTVASFVIQIATCRNSQ